MAANGFLSANEWRTWRREQFTMKSPKEIMSVGNRHASHLTHHDLSPTDAYGRMSSCEAVVTTIRYHCARANIIELVTLDHCTRRWSTTTCEKKCLRNGRVSDAGLSYAALIGLVMTQTCRRTIYDMIMRDLCNHSN